MTKNCTIIAFIMLILAGGSTEKKATVTNGWPSRAERAR
jgi:hypothetical protein